MKNTHASVFCTIIKFTFVARETLKVAKCEFRDLCKRKNDVPFYITKFIKFA